MNPLVWALWIFAGGEVNSGYLTQPTPVAYFQDLGECERVAKRIVETSVYHYDGKVVYRLQNRIQFIQARYIK